MKTTRMLIFSLSIFLISLYSCQKDKNTVSTDYPFQAEVLTRNPDCGLYEIIITKGLEKVESMITPKTPVKGIYIAQNLPDNLKVPGLFIVLDLRQPTNDELGASTYSGPSYSWVHVIRAKRK